MRILYFHQHFSTPSGAVGSRSFEQAKALVREGHSVHMICGSYKAGNTGVKGDFHRGVRSGLVSGFQVTEFEIPYKNSDGFLKRTFLFFLFSFRSVVLVLREPCDVVFATSTPLTASLPGIAGRIFKKRVFVFEVRDLWPELPKAMGVIRNPIILTLMSILERVSYRCADGCIGLSPGIVSGIKKNAPDNTDIAMIPNGCDIHLFGSDDVVAKRLMEIESSHFVAIFPGAHGMANGLDSVLDSSKILNERGRNDIHCLFIGDGKLKRMLVDRARVEGLHCCHFLEPTPKHDLVSFMRGADVGLMILANVPAFYYGTSPNKFFDYLAAGLPVLVNYPGWIADMVDDAEFGVTVPPGDPEALADALIHLADNRHLLTEMGKNAKIYGESHFERAQLVSRFVSFLEKIYDRKRSS